MSGIYDQIYSLLCSVLNDDVLAQLRTTLHSAMDEQELRAFCSNRDRLPIVNFLKGSVAHGPIREFRGTVFSVRLCARVEADSTDSEVRNFDLRAEISDGTHISEIPLASEHCRTKAPQTTSQD